MENNIDKLMNMWKDSANNGMDESFVVINRYNSWGKRLAEVLGWYGVPIDHEAGVLFSVMAMVMLDYNGYQLKEFEPEDVYSNSYWISWIKVLQQFRKKRTGFYVSGLAKIDGAEIQNVHLQNDICRNLDWALLDSPLMPDWIKKGWFRPLEDIAEWKSIDDMKLHMFEWPSNMDILIKHAVFEGYRYDSNKNAFYKVCISDDDIQKLLDGLENEKGANAWECKAGKPIRLFGAYASMIQMALPRVAQEFKFKSDKLNLIGAILEVGIPNYFSKLDKDTGKLDSYANEKAKGKNRFNWDTQNKVNHDIKSFKKSGCCMPEHGGLYFEDEGIPIDEGWLEQMIQMRPAYFKVLPDWFVKCFSTD